MDFNVGSTGVDRRALFGNNITIHYDGNICHTGETESQECNPLTEHHSQGGAERLG